MPGTRKEEKCELAFVALSQLVKKTVIGQGHVKQQPAIQKISEVFTLISKVCIFFSVPDKRLILFISETNPYLFSPVQFM